MRSRSGFVFLDSSLAGPNSLSLLACEPDLVIEGDASEWGRLERELGARQRSGADLGIPDGEIETLNEVEGQFLPVAHPMKGPMVTLSLQGFLDATEELDASAEGADLTVAFNPDYLAAGVEAVGSDQITLSTIDPMKPAVIRAVGREDYLYLLMPVRVP